ncbi:MAG: riboflavin synthase [Candidatus Nanohaloarchaea archaeon]
MFTGLVEETAEVMEIAEAGEGKRIEVDAAGILEDVATGGSVSVSGACLTLEEKDPSVFFLSEETLERTWFPELEEGDELNIERSLKPEDRMGGHVVQGHVEGTGEVLEVEELDEGWNMEFSLPTELEKYVVEKGFITVDGVSLTVTEFTRKGFRVTVIPETWEKTNLSAKQPGDGVNIETDVMARYAEKMVPNS